MTTREDWDIVSSVGLTALAVAAGRAIDGHRADRLVDDPYAAEFIRAAEPPVPMPTQPPESDDADYRQVWNYLSDRLAVRSRYFDQFFRNAADAGARQGVILASGLDTRAYRLSWPEGFRLFEVDQPKVLEFKDQVLDRASATAACDLRPVRVDLREDWESALAEAGFDRGRPTAWLAEGLLPYLPPEAEQQLLETLHRCSAPGSSAALEVTSPSQRTGSGWAPLLSKYIGVDMTSLVHSDERPAPDTTLAALGWTTEVDTVLAAADRYERALDPKTRDLSGSSGFVTAHLPG
jgi:methyltransferase (TIGR00027 family)